MHLPRVVKQMGKLLAFIFVKTVSVFCDTSLSHLAENTSGYQSNYSGMIFSEANMYKAFKLNKIIFLPYILTAAIFPIKYRTYKLSWLRFQGIPVKQACYTGCAQTLADETPPTGKIQQFRKTTVAFKPVTGFGCPLELRMF